MNNHMDHRSTEMAVQRCVDGEMSETEQQEFLRSLDQSPSTSGWRDLALAFVEHQLWSQAGRAWIDEPAPPLAGGDEFDPPLTHRDSWLRKTALAASGLLAVGLGYVGGTFWRSGSQGTSPLVQTTAPSSPGADNSEVALASDRIPSEVMRVEWPSESGVPISLPVYESQGFRPPQGWRDPYVPQITIPAGSRVNLQPEYLTVPVDDQRNLVIPVRHVKPRFQ